MYGQNLVRVTLRTSHFQRQSHNSGSRIRSGYGGSTEPLESPRLLGSGHPETVEGAAGSR
jgi:hypothetical protein